MCIWRYRGPRLIMFDDLIREATEEYKRLISKRPESVGSRTLGQLEMERDKLWRIISNLDEFLYTTLPNMIRDAGKYVVDWMIEDGSASAALYESFLRVIPSCQEFNEDIFISKLTGPLLNPATIQMTPRGYSVDVLINLNATAGSISEYSSAIKQVRATLDQRKQSEAKRGHPYVPSTQSIVSKFWEEIYTTARLGGAFYRRKYDRATRTYTRVDVSDEIEQKYWNTMEMRLEASGKPAPFWELIDRGSTAMRDGSGKYFPAIAPTNFVNSAIFEIRGIYMKRYADRVKMFEKDEKEVTKLRDELMRRYAEILIEIEAKQREIVSQASPQEVAFSRKVIKSGKPYDFEKLTAVLNALTSKRLGAISITKEGRVELTARGQKRYRPYITGIIKRFGL